MDFDNRGVVALSGWCEEADEGLVKEIRYQYVCCGGDYDRTLSKRYFTDGYVNACAELRDYFTPTLYLKAVMAFCNELNDPKIQCSEEAFDQEKRF